MPKSNDLQWHAEALWQQLEPLLPGMGVEVVARAESTNTVLIERARRAAGRPDLPISTPGEFDPLEPLQSPHGRRSADTQACLLVAEHQTRGRGRLGRSWLSGRGASLTFSLALPYEPPDWSGLSLAVGVALADALDPLSPTQLPRIGLKWPNDLWLLDVGGGNGGSGGDQRQPKKLGGVLIETVPVGERRMCIVGVGLNILPQAHEGFSTGFACLQQLDADASAPAALACVAEPLLRALSRFEGLGFAAFEAAYARRDLLRGHDVTTTLPSLPEGRAEGVDARGALRVVDRGGKLHTLVGGEVSVRPAATAASVGPR